jgi:hypothetical protein
VEIVRVQSSGNEFIVDSPFGRRVIDLRPGLNPRRVISMQIAIKERRKTQREDLSVPVRVCPCDSQYPEEVCTTLNVSRNGLYFATDTGHYFPGMNVIVTLNFRWDDPMQREYIGDVARLERLEDGKWGVAIRILMRYNSAVYSGT